MHRLAARWGCLLAIAASWLPAQQLFQSAPGRELLFQPSDRAVLAAGKDRNDLPCRVIPQNPHLGFDLKFTAGYVVQLPAAAISGGDDDLRVLFRVTPTAGPDREASYFRQSFGVPAARSEGRGPATFPGRFVVGPGQYEVDWLMRNRAGQVCSAHWKASARYPAAVSALAAATRPNSVAPFAESMFAEAAPVVRASDRQGGLHVSLLVNLSPLERDRFKLSDHELDCVVGMLRSLHAEPSLGLFSLTAFNAYDRRLVYSVRGQPRLDFEALGEAIEMAPAGVVDVEALADPGGEQRFLAEMISGAMVPAPRRPDAVIIVGPKLDREARLAEGALSLSARPAVLHQFAFHRYRQSYPWMGAIESALKPHGLVVSSVSRAQDFARALADLMQTLQGGPPSQE